jgi:hypothetical protein
VDSVANLEPNARLDRLMRWSIQQRDLFASSPGVCEYFESKLLFPDTDISDVPECRKGFANHVSDR